MSDTSVYSPKGVYIGRKFAQAISFSFTPHIHSEAPHPKGRGALHITNPTKLAKTRDLSGFVYLPTQKFLNTSFTTVSVAFSPVKTESSSIAQSTETFIASVVIPIIIPST